MKKLVFPLLITTAAFFLSSCGGGSGEVIEAGKFTILGTRTDEADRAKAKKNAEVTLLQHPDIDAMVGLWAYNAPACIEALKDKKMVGKVKVFSFDEDAATLQGIKNGSMEGTIVQNPYEFGYQSMKYLNMIHDKVAFDIPENKEVDIPARTITKENVEAFSAELAERRRLGKEAESAPKAESNKRFAFVINVVDPFWTYAQAGCSLAESEFGLVADFLAPPTGTVEEQRKILESILLQDYDGVAISPVDPANQSDILNQLAAKMPLLCHDSDAPNSDRRFYLGTNNYDAGRMLGKLLKARMPDGGNIMVYVGKIDMLNSQQRRQGLIDELSAE